MSNPNLRFQILQIAAGVHATTEEVIARATAYHAFVFNEGEKADIPAPPPAEEELPEPGAAKKKRPTKEEHAAEPEKTTLTPAVTYDDIKDLVLKLAANGKGEAVGSALAKYKAKTTLDLKKEQYGAFYDYLVAEAA